MSSILSEPFFLIQVARCSSILTLYNCSSLCDAASSLTRISLHTHAGTIAKSATIRRTSHSGIVFLIFVSPCTQDGTRVYKKSRSPVGLPAQGSLAMLARAALLRPVSRHALALSLTLSIGGVLGGGAFLQRSSNLAGVFPSCPLLAGIVRPSSLLSPLPGASLGACSGYCRCPRAPSASGTLHTGALRSALCRWCLGQWRSTALLLADRLSPQLFLR